MVHSFEKRTDYLTKFDDINSIYKEGIELISDEATGDGGKTAQSAASSQAAGALPQAPEEGLYTIKGPFVTIRGG